MTESSAMESTDDPCSHPGERRGFFTRGRFALVLAILIFISFWNVLLGFETFVVRDFGIFSYPNAYFQKECFWKGELPFWNPYDCCGLPFLAQFNTLALYPPALIYLLLPLAWALPFFCLLHLFIGGIGMYTLAERWTGSRTGAALAGTAFAFNGLSLNFLMWPSHIATFAWLPWVLYLTERAWREGGRSVVLAAMAAAMEILGGGPETILFTWLIAAALLLLDCWKTKLFRRRSRRFVLTGLLSGGLAAAQLLPFLQLISQSSRNASYATSDWAMPIWGWASFLVPRFHLQGSQGPAMQPGQYWTSSYYVGIAIVLLAVLAFTRQRSWRTNLIAAFIVIAMILALGDSGGLYLALRKACSFLGFFRFPIKFVIITSALFPLLAAAGFSQYETIPARSNFPGRREWICLGLICGLTGYILVLGHVGWSRLGALVAFFILVRIYSRQTASQSVVAILLVALCWLDLTTAVPWQNPTLNPSVYRPDLGQLTDKLEPAPHPGESRLMLSSLAAHEVYYHPPPDLRTSYLLDRAAFLGDCNLLDHFPKVDGFYSLYLHYTDQILWLLDGRTGDKLDRLEDFLGVSETIAPGKIYDWVPRTNYLPVVSGGQAPIFADDRISFIAVSNGPADFRKTVYLPPEAQPLIQTKGNSTLKIVREVFDANNVRLEVEASGPAMVVLTQAYYPNWRAKVDGKDVPLWRADYAFQAVETPTGRHEIDFVYEDKMFRIGTLLTGAAMLACATLWLTSRRRAAYD